MQFSTQHLQIPSRSWTKEELLQQLSPEQVMERLGLPLDEEFSGRSSPRFCSPFRDDRHPDCKLHYSPAGTLYFLDPAHGLSLDWIACVRYAHNTDYPGALQWVADAFALAPDSPPTAAALRKLNTVPHRAASVIQIKARPWNKADLGYWALGHVSPRELLLGRVWPISDYWLNGQHRRAPAMSYAYAEDDGYKLYFTQERGPYRFLSTTRALSCYELLPQRGELLVITSSKKDALCLLSFGYPAVSLQGEHMEMPAHLLWELKQRFRRQLIFYDNDGPGLLAAQAKCARWQVSDYVCLPLDEAAKDPFGYAARYGAAAAQRLFTTILTPHDPHPAAPSPA